MKRTVTIPTKWEDVTLGQYIEFVRAIDEQCPVTQEAKIVAAFTKGLTYAECMNHIPYSDLHSLAGRIYTLLNSKPPKRLQHKVMIDGQQFGFHPNLIGMSAGEFIDLTTLDKGFWGDAHKAMAILYRPITAEWGKKYQIEKYDDKHYDNGELMLQLPMDVVFGAAAFFLTLTEELAKISMTFFIQLSKEGAQMLKELTDQTEQAWHGTSSFTHWQEAN